MLRSIPSLYPVVITIPYRIVTHPRERPLVRWRTLLGSSATSSLDGAPPLPLDRKRTGQTIFFLWDITLDGSYPLFQRRAEVQIPPCTATKYAHTHARTGYAVQTSGRIVRCNVYFPL